MDKELEEVYRLEISMDNLKSLIGDAVQAGRKAEKVETKKAKNPNYAETERLLYKYPMLKLKIDQDDLDIRDLKKEMEHGGTQKSRDIVYKPTGGIRLDPDEKQQALIDDKETSRSKTLREIAKIEKALDKVRGYKGFNIIELKYFERIEPDDEIIDQLCIGRTAFYQWKNRIINDLSVILFG